MKGDFVIKTSKGPFNAVAVDTKLEQTIQRSAKSVGGIIGRSKAVDYIMKWLIIGITNWFRELTQEETQKHVFIMRGKKARLMKSTPVSRR